ncbi:DUF1254 domain-containing protein [Brevibacillus sp. GCM10020057]|uniref:DUF1254 domain-containing protein n=1 Tax=Brevibacillus sp. GCM10020057 TaxID=3317327 RepID=UPI00363EA610
MKKYFRYACTVFVAAALAAAPSPARTLEVSSERHPPAIAEEALAYSLGVQAYLYGYPLVAVAKTMGEMTRDGALLNQFVYSDALATPSYRGIVTPNSDTLYLNAWLDLSQTPVLLQVPANPQHRYYTVQMLDAYTNTFHNESNRATADKARQSVIVGPGWKGTLPTGVRTIQAPTDTVWLLGRVEVKGKQDLAQALAFEHQIQLKPVQQAKQSGAAGVSSVVPQDVLHSLAFFRVMTDMLQKNPPPVCDQVLLTQFALAGIDAQTGFDPARIRPATRAGLERALRDAPSIVENGYPPYIMVENGWGSFSPIGTYGDQFLARAFIAYSGIGANVPEEEAYFRAFTDGDNRPLTGEKAYTLHFAPDQLPQTSAFWSINVYDNQLYLAKATGNRVSVRSNNGTLRLNPDGSLDIAIQKSPPADPQANWLSTPPGPFNLVLRIFAPKPGSLGPAHALPPIREKR